MYFFQFVEHITSLLLLLLASKKKKIFNANSINMCISYRSYLPCIICLLYYFFCTSVLMSTYLISTFTSLSNLSLSSFLFAYVSCWHAFLFQFFAASPSSFNSFLFFLWSLAIHTHTHIIFLLLQLLQFNEYEQERKRNFRRVSNHMRHM